VKKMMCTTVNGLLTSAVAQLASSLSHLWFPRRPTLAQIVSASVDPGFGASIQQHRL